MAQTMNQYLFASYFRDINALSSLSMISLPLSFRISSNIWSISKFGKKEFSVFGMCLASGAYAVLYFMKVTNPWIFIVLYLVACIGTIGFNMFIWAHITDVIDYNEVKFGERNDGVIYGVYSFARKIGQALAGGLGGYALAFIGYNAAVQEQTTKFLTVYTLIQHYSQLYAMEL